MSDGDRDAILGVNLIGVWNTVKAALPALIERGEGGRILACGSVESVLGGAGLAAYVASKHGLVGFIKSVALECRAARDHGERRLPGGRRHRDAAHRRPA